MNDIRNRVANGSASALSGSQSTGASWFGVPVFSRPAYPRSQDRFVLSEVTRLTLSCKALQASARFGIPASLRSAFGTLMAFRQMKLNSGKFSLIKDGQILSNQIQEIREISAIRGSLPCAAKTVHFGTKINVSRKTSSIHQRLSKHCQSQLYRFPKPETRNV
jgi:hypothetical protein